MFVRRFSFIISILILGFILGFFVFGKIFSPSGPAVVAITQIVHHPSLDQIRQGIKDVLILSGIKESEILFQSAQGSPATALQIAQKFVSVKPKIIVPITTPSAQSVYSQARPAGIPVIFSAVNDPISAKLIDPAQPSMIAGVSDFPPVSEQVGLIREILPKAKTIGILYNAGESNSVAVVERFKKEVEGHDFTVVTATISSSNDVSTAAMSLVGKIDVLYLPNDNTVISALESVLKITQKEKIPLFTSDPESVSRGALASICHNQYELGRQTGYMVMAYLKGERTLPSMGVQIPKQVELVINEKTAKALGLTMSEGILKRARYIVR